ncbi:hypothetical protein ACJW31_05G112300 [Castanea mollissima]
MISGDLKKIQKPKPWKHTEPITRTQLMQMHDEFWDTAPHYGGQKAAEADLTLAQTIVECAGVIIQSARYELPKYVLSEPNNLIWDLTIG